jgi:iron(III) transport system ATP-binding protein
VLGKSGGGKSTLLNAIAGFERLDDGFISLEGQTISAKNVFVEPSKRGIGFVFQNYALFPHLNVFENVSFALSGVSKAYKKEKIAAVLELINLSGYEKKYPHVLSGGEQQRVALARVLVMEPKLILFDEAFSSVDTVLKASIQKELLAILRKLKTTAIFVTHDPKEAMAISDKIAFLENGRVVQFDSPENIYLNPVSKDTASFFGPVNVCSGKYIRVEKCRLNKSSGDFVSTVEESVFMGGTYETTVNSTIDGLDCRFLVYTDCRYEKDEKLFLNISEF